MSKPKKVREPMQVYLDQPDRDLLEEMAGETGLTRAELLRRGIRSLAENVLSGPDHGSSLEQMIGALGDGPDLPSDLAENHDRYLHGPDSG